MFFVSFWLLQSLCRSSFVGATFGRPFCFAIVCGRSMIAPTSKHPYENEPNFNGQSDPPEACRILVSGFVNARGCHTFSPARKYAKIRREPSVWFSDSPDGQRGKRTSLFVKNNLFAVSPFGIPLGTLQRIVGRWLLPAQVFLPWNFPG